MSTAHLKERRRFGALVAALCAGGTSTARVASAQSNASGYPSRTVQMIVGYGPGGGTDTLARMLAGPLAKVLGQPVIVRNVPGAGGQIAATTMLREAADGHAILALNHPDLSIAVERSAGVLKAADLHVILVDVKDPRVLLVRKDSDIATFADFVKRAKAEPGRLTISVTQGSAQELFARWLVKRLALDVTIVGYKGGVEAANGILTGEVTATLGDDYARFTIRDRARALFIAASTRSPRWPEAETLSKVLEPLGVVPPSPDFMARFGIYVVPAEFARKQPAVYEKLQRAMIEARGSAVFTEFIDKNRLTDLSIGKAGEGFHEAFAADVRGW